MPESPETWGQNGRDTLRLPVTRIITSWSKHRGWHFPTIHPPITNPSAMRTAHRDSPAHQGAHWQPLPQVDSQASGCSTRTSGHLPGDATQTAHGPRGTPAPARLTALEGGPSFRPISKWSFSSFLRLSPLLRIGGPARPPPVHSRPLELRGRQYQRHRWFFQSNPPLGHQPAPAEPMPTLLLLPRRGATANQEQQCCRVPAPEPQVTLPQCCRSNQRTRRIQPQVCKLRWCCSHFTPL